MKSNNARLWVLSFLILVAIPKVWADEPGAAPASDPVKLSLGAVLDTYYSYNFNNFSHRVQGIGNYGYFNSVDDNYTLGLAEISLTAKQGQGSAHVALIYGETPNRIGYFSADYLWEAYVSYHPADWVFRFGVMATHVGFEKIESPGDWNFSRSLLFNYTQSAHPMGFSVEFAPTDVFSATAYVYSNWLDFVAPHKGKNYGLKLQFKPQADFTVTFNALVSPFYNVNPDPFGAYLTEGIIQWKVMDRLTLALDGEYIGLNWGGGVQSKAGGAALYARYQIGKDWAVALRLEEFFDEQAGYFLYGVGLNKMEGREATLTLEHQFTPQVMGRLEGRFDYGLVDGVPFSAGPFAAALDPYQVTATANMVFSL